jgi:hypothetical protein
MADEVSIMATTATTDVAYLSKQIYPNGFDPKQLVRDKPALMNTPHKKNFSSSEGIVFPAKYGNAGGASATIANAAANAKAQAGKKFIVTQATYYTNISVAGLVVRNAMKGGADAQFMDQLKSETDGAQETMGVELNRQLFGSQDGWRAQTSATTAPSGSTITLANASDCVFFEVGMIIVAASTPGGAIAAGTPGYATISNVDESAGTITVVGTATTLITGLSTSWYLYLQGDARNNGTARVAAGLFDWNPTSTSGLSTTFFNVARDAYPARLAGARYNGAGDPIQTVFIKAMQNFKMQVGPGWKNGDIYINPLNMSQLMSAVEGTRFQEGEKMTSYGIGLQTVKYGTMTFIQDSLCPLNVARVVAEGAFVRASCGDQPVWNGEVDGSEFFVDRTTDVLVGSLVHDGNFAALNPNQLGVITLPSYQA